MNLTWSKLPKTCFFRSKPSKQVFFFRFPESNREKKIPSHVVRRLEFLTLVFGKYPYGFLVSSYHPQVFVFTLEKSRVDFDSQEAPRFRLHACWCRFASVHGYRCRRRRTVDFRHRHGPDPFFDPPKSPWVYSRDALRQSMGALGAVPFFLGTKNPWVFSLLTKKRRYNNKFISSLDPERSWHVEVYHPHLSKMGRFASIVGSHQWKVYGFLFFAHCLLNDPLWCPCGPNGLGQVGGRFVDESGSSGDEKLSQGESSWQDCLCHVRVFLFFLWDWKTLKEQGGTSCMYIIDKVSAFFQERSYASVIVLLMLDCDSECRLKKPWKISLSDMFFISSHPELLGKLGFSTTHVGVPWRNCCQMRL